MKLSVVIPNYNTWDLVKRNIDSLLYFDKDFIEEIIVVDDCSPIENYIEFSSVVTIVRNEKNLQYTKTVNTGLRKAKSDIVVLLDSDAYLVEPILEKIITIFKQNNQIGCIGLATQNEDGNDSGNFLPEPSALSLISGQQIHKLLRGYNIFESKNKLPFSCAVSFQKKCLVELHYFDENFEVLEADHDFSIRVIRSKNWQLKYEPTIKVFHVGGNSYKPNAQRVINFYKSRWALLKKHNKIHFKSAVKFLIVVRLLIESFIFYNKKIIGNSEVNNDKFTGRIKLIKELYKLS